MNSYERVNWDQIQAGDILCGREELWPSKWKVLQVNHEVSSLITSWGCKAEVKLSRVGKPEITCYSLFNGTYLREIRMLQYDPNQQGEEEDDI